MGWFDFLKIGVQCSIKDLFDLNYFINGLLNNKGSSGGRNLCYFN